MYSVLRQSNGAIYWPYAGLAALGVPSVCWPKGCGMPFWEDVMRDQLDALGINNFLASHAVQHIIGFQESIHVQTFD